MVGLRVEPGTAGADGLERRSSACRCRHGCGEVDRRPTGTAVAVAGARRVPAWSAPTTATDCLAADLRRTRSAVSPGAVVDLSANRTTLELSGPPARAGAGKGLPAGPAPAQLQARARRSPPSSGPVPVLLWQTAERTLPGMILPRASFADFTGPLAAGRDDASSPRPRCPDGTERAGPVLRRHRAVVVAHGGPDAGGAAVRRRR